MRLNSTAQILSLVLKSLNDIIAPDLVSPEAKATLEIIELSLKDLLKRQGLSRDLLSSIIREGSVLEKDMRDELGQRNFQQHYWPTDTFEELSQRYEKLLKVLAELSTTLSLTETPNSQALLRRAAAWEYSYYSKLPTLEAISYYGESDSDKILQSGMTKDEFQKFIGKTASKKFVLEFERMIGGHGKQTYLAKVRDQQDGSDEELVIRKEDATPLIKHGMFRVDHEYHLLKALSKTDFPSPRPYELKKDSTGSFGSFFTMERLPGSIFSTYLNSGEVTLSENTILQLADLLAKLHSYPLKTFSEYFKYVGQESEDSISRTIEEWYSRALKNWSTYMKQTRHLPSTYMTWLFDWLQRHIPKDSRPAVLFHGDFSVHNILAADGSITGVLDWECAEFGAPEQDLVYLRPLLEKSSVGWQKFIDRYLESSGKSIDESIFPFCQAYSVFKVMLAFNSGTLNLQTGLTKDIRLLMVEYQYQSAFMALGLDYTFSDSYPLDPNSPLMSSSVASEIGGSPSSVVTVYGDEANVRQSTPVVENWQDSVVLVWWDDENQVGGFHRLGHEVGSLSDIGKGSAVLWTGLIGPDGIFTRTQTKPLRDEDLIPGGGFGSGDTHCSVEFKNGSHIWTIDETDENIKAKLVHIDTGPTVDCFPKSGAIGKGFASAHLDIPGRLTGEVTIKGKTYSIVNGLSLRDHAWGVRDWGNSGLSHRWVIGTCGSEFSFVVVSWQNASHRIDQFGWVIRNNVVTTAKQVDILTYVEVDACNNRGGKVDLELVTGEFVEIHCLPVAQSIVSWHRGMACVDRICKFKATVDSAKYHGFANFESTSNIQHGEKRPRKIVDGVIDNGYTSLTQTSA